MKILYYLSKHLQFDESNCVFKTHAFFTALKHGIYSGEQKVRPFYFIKFFKIT